MRLTIATKLFFGFLCVILLNASFIFVINKMGSVNGIVNILKYQNEVKNNLLRLKTLHRVRGPSIISYEKIGRQESITNFQEINSKFVLLIDTIHLQVDSIIVMDSRLISKKRETFQHTSMADMAMLLRNVGLSNSRYVASFEKIVKIRKQPISPKSSTLKTLFEKIVKIRKQPTSPKSYTLKTLFMDTLNMAESTISRELDSAESIISIQTDNRIKDIAANVIDINQSTVLILSGITLFAIIFGLIFSRTITDSLRRLKESASQIGKADFNINPSGYPNDETGDLATAFFDMAVDLKNKQEEVIKSKRLAAMGEVIASVNHEINNPLMIISGNAQFLEMSMDGFTDEMKERVHTILEETDRISRVTKKLREIKNPISEDYILSGEQMINLDKSTQ
jgi:nitrogen fixation/metabolism regulation signal transduction histidine kinase